MPPIPSFFFTLDSYISISLSPHRLALINLQFGPIKAKLKNTMSMASTMFCEGIKFPTPFKFTYNNNNNYNNFLSFACLYDKSHNVVFLGSCV